MAQTGNFRSFDPLVRVLSSRHSIFDPFCSFQQLTLIKQDQDPTI